MNCRIKNTYSLVKRILYMKDINLYIVVRYDCTTHQITNEEAKRLVKSLNFKYKPSGIGSNWGYYK